MSGGSRTRHLPATLTTVTTSDVIKTFLNDARDIVNYIFERVLFGKLYSFTIVSGRLLRKSESIRTRIRIKLNCF